MDLTLSVYHENHFLKHILYSVLLHNWLFDKGPFIKVIVNFLQEILQNYCPPCKIVQSCKILKKILSFKKWAYFFANIAIKLPKYNPIWISNLKRLFKTPRFFEFMHLWHFSVEQTSHLRVKKNVLWNLS